jgi:hypothetical protein
VDSRGRFFFFDRLFSHVPYISDSPQRLKLFYINIR